MAEKLGTQEVKDVVAGALGVSSLIEAVADGISIGDIGELVQAARKVPAAIAAIKSGKLIPELKDLDDAEKADLKKWSVDECDLEDDKAEAVIEQVLSVAIDLSDLLKVLA